MKLQCDLVISPRNGTMIAQKRCKAIVCLCYTNKTEEYHLEVTTAKKSTKFELNKETMENVLKRFIAQGRVTIQLKRPSLDLCLSQCPVEQLNRLVRLIDQVCNGDKPSIGHLHPVKSTDFRAVPTKLSINAQSAYPSQGFPSTLEELSIHLNMRRVDGRWFGLRHLRVLDLSGNQLGIAVNWSKLSCISRLDRLQRLSLASNQISHLDVQMWYSFPVTVTELNLSNNRLIEIPDAITRMRQLQRLDVSNNLLRFVTPKMGHMRLTSLVLASNQLMDIPHSYLDGLRNSLQLIDLNDNPLLNPSGNRLEQGTLMTRSDGQGVLMTRSDGQGMLMTRSDDMASLQEMVACTIRDNGLPTDILPAGCRELIDGLSNCDGCGRSLCSSWHSTRFQRIPLSKMAHTSTPVGAQITIRSRFCLPRCALRQ